MDASAKLQQPIAKWFRNRRLQWERWRITLHSAHEWKQMQQQAQHAASLQIALTEQVLENQRLRLLLDARQKTESSHAVWAQVIGRKSAPVSNLLRINRGHQHGLHVGDCVVSPHGIVGQIVIVAKTCSHVLLISAPGSTVDVMVQSTRARGMARGMGGTKQYGLHVEDFDRLDTVHAGDTVVTSGVTSDFAPGFPKGLAVGTVQTTTPTKDGVYLQAQLVPAVDLARLEEVLVLTRKQEQEQSD